MTPSIKGLVALAAASACGRFDFDRVRDASIGDVDGDARSAETVCSSLSGVIFCDGFEDDAGFTAWGDPPSVQGGVVMRTDFAYRGRGALHAETTSPAGHAMLRTQTALVDTGEYWLRMYAWFRGTDTLEHIDLAKVVAPGSANGVALYLQTNSPYGWIDESMTFYMTTADVPRDQWTCLQLHLVVSDTAGAAEIYLDGVLAGSWPGLDVHPPTGFGALQLGITFSNTMQPPAVITIDEVSATTTQVACD